MASTKAKKRWMKFKGFLWQAFSLAALRRTGWQRCVLQRQIGRLGIERLHVGCGHFLLPGWLNIGFEPRQEYGRIRTIKGALFLNYNLLKPWPVPENSVSFIAASHFIEHFDLNQGLDFTRRCFSVLRKGGVLRLSCPDLETYARKYAEGDRSFFEHPQIREWCCFKQAVTPGEIFIAKAYDSGGAHKWFYDFDSLRHIFESAGFVNVRRVQRLEGRTPDLERLEPPGRELETVYVEGEKAGARVR